MYVQLMCIIYIHLWSYGSSIIRNHIGEVRWDRRTLPNKQYHYSVYTWGAAKQTWKAPPNCLDFQKYSQYFLVVWKFPNVESEASPKKPMNLYIYNLYVIYIYMISIQSWNYTSYVMHSHHFLTPQLGAETCKLVLNCGWFVGIIMYTV